MIKSNTNYNLHNLMESKEGNKILDYRNRTRIDEKYIPQIFNKKLVFQSYDSFQQNNYFLSKEVRRIVKNHCNEERINGIGGESYLYGKYCNFYTNSISIYNDYIFNGGRLPEFKFPLCRLQYNKCSLIDYNNDNIKLIEGLTIINMSRLNKNIMKQVNKSVSNKLIIINCHHKDFWNKVKLLTNYKLIKREKIVDYKLRYFITVNIFLRKSIISLGGDCSVCYQLNKLGLRNKSYPFDWCKMSLNNLINIMENDFKDFERVELKRYSQNHKSYILKNDYVEFAHEVLEKNKIDNFSQRLKIRVERFKRLKNPVFINIENKIIKNKAMYKSKWLKLIKLLRLYFNNFKIILLSNINPEIDEIRFKYYGEKTEDWKKDNINWREIIYNI